MIPRRVVDIHSDDPLLVGAAEAAYGGQMATDPQIELRVSRLENDRDSIYDLVSEIRSTQQEHSRRFDEVDGRFAEVDRRFDAVDRRFDGVDRRFDGIDRRFDNIDAALAEVVRRLPDSS